MTEKTLSDFNRRNLNFTQSKVKDVLPSYYTSEYPDLVKFLEYYYDFMDSDVAHGFDTKIQNIYKVRDLVETDVNSLNQIFNEIGQGLVSSDYFINPRLAAGLLANFYRIKGSLYSAEGFFRAFYGEEAEIVYPKNNLFIVGQSQIGSESLKFIQNGALYQILSVLIRSSIPISVWRDLYKSFVHPSGFFLGGEVIIESISDLNLNLMPLSVDAGAAVFVYDALSAQQPETLSSITLIYPDGADADSNDERLVTDNILKYQNLTLQELDQNYSNIQTLLDPNSPTFDEDSTGSNTIIRFSNNIETMDQDIFEGLYGTADPGEP